MSEKDEKQLTLDMLSTKQVAVFAQSSLESFWEELESQYSDDEWQAASRLLSPHWKKKLNRALLFSPFFQQLLKTQQVQLVTLLSLPIFDKPLPETFFQARLESSAFETEDQLACYLRQERQLFMCRFIVQHTNQLVSLEQLMMELSLFADACIEKVQSWHAINLSKRYGQPIGEHSKVPQRFVVLAMGKLGARELNLSSDIDLIFAYPEAGYTDGQFSISNQEFFSALGKALIATLNRKTVDGFVFRVDMRLRPYGQSGLLVYSYKALEIYYQDQGREWERYALIKARAVGDSVEGAQLEQTLAPFVYRKYTDFSALEGIRDMKKLIVKEVRRLDKKEDIKLGAGGIREVEFIAQVYQLIYGGKKSELQIRSLFHVYDVLVRLNLVEPDVAKQLLSAYAFLRRVEHSVQAIHDEQTHRLPVDSEWQKKLALSMGFDQWRAFVFHLNEHRLNVREHFNAMVESKPLSSSHVVDQPFQLSRENAEPLIEWLKAQRFCDEEQRLWLRFFQSDRVKKLQPIEWYRLKRTSFLLLPLLSSREDRLSISMQLVKLLEAVVQRSTYLVLLYENPQALERLIDVASDCSWVMTQYISFPSLLDELLEFRPIEGFSSLDNVSASLQQQGLRIPQEDLEEQMDMLRYFKMANVCGIALAESRGDLHLFNASNDLTYVAEAVLGYVLDLAWFHLTEKFGYPTNDQIPYEKPPFTIVAYGKLGGAELSYSSDLDLVFLYDAPMHSQTDGDSPIDNVAFFTRLAQRVMHILSTRTLMGQLYDIDIRLRPSGNKGLLVTSVEAFLRYQANSAWTWEQQALVRARPVAGSKQIARRFNELRAEIIREARDMVTLTQDVVAMREKMAKHLTPQDAKGEDAVFFDVKYSRWGIIDIEFMVQFYVLAYSHVTPRLSQYTDNLRLLEALVDCGLISHQERQLMVDAYLAYRTFVHEAALKQTSVKATSDVFAEHRQNVQRLWQQLVEKTLGA